MDSLCSLGNIVHFSILLFLIHAIGFLVEFISFPVISGFTSSAAITIIASEIKVSNTGCIDLCSIMYKEVFDHVKARPSMYMYIYI